MASPNLKSHFHARWVSLPSKPNLLIPQAEEHLMRIRSSEATARLLLFPDTQHALVQEGREGVLERSLSLLDLCSAIKDVIAQTKENMQELQSTLRRRRGDDLARRNRLRSCSFFGKLMHSKRVAADERASNCNIPAPLELEEVDSADHTFLSHKNGKLIQMEYLQKILAEIESSSQDLEEEVERLIRRLIKTRASLLNILNH
ncbi:hypothetical protein EUGRSUZ_I01502 [Eucalyptus grandis]|uniref:Uncharacterized protein n=2 Tax=Eucalyptus grandis TaxID=71139 RepID=A0ACC3JH36_EUCGR|nr:hypothetical protein EUGRSUZ_I01502 [Eucalyptus grandis]